MKLFYEDETMVVDRWWSTYSFAVTIKRNSSECFGYRYCVVSVVEPNESELETGTTAQSVPDFTYGKR